MKELKLKAVGPCYSIYWENGGEVPQALLGLFTSQREAQLAIDRWQASKPPKQRSERVVSHGEKQK